MSIKPILRADDVLSIAFTVFQFRLSRNMIATIEIFIEGEVMIKLEGKILPLALPPMTCLNSNNCNVNKCVENFRIYFDCK